MRAAIRRALLLGGYEIIQASTGQEGLERAQNDVPDAIVLDLGLPDIDGIEVCRTLRRAGNRTPKPSPLRPTQPLSPGSLARTIISKTAGRARTHWGVVLGHGRRRRSNR